MIKKIAFILILVFSSFIKADLIKFQCSMAGVGDNWGKKPKVLFSLTMGVETKKAIQTLKKGNLQMDLLVTKDHYELGMYTDETKRKDRFIPVMKLNKVTLNIDYAKYMDLVTPITCLKL
tara:strand:- start:189 stop:548 length:360 start_codon:yes stop_codon:yes gene_type:complete